MFCGRGQGLAYVRISEVVVVGVGVGWRLGNLEVVECFVAEVKVWLM